MRKAIALQLIILSSIALAKILFNDYGLIAIWCGTFALQISCITFFWELIEW